jgi:hypothetical protein
MMGRTPLLSNGIMLPSWIIYGVNGFQRDHPYTKKRGFLTGHIRRHNNLIGADFLTIEPIGSIDPQNVDCDA